MEPIKFEEHIREKLQEREISPSIKSWEKLEKHLDKTNPNKKTNKSLWLSIAAGFVGIIIVTSFVFKEEIFSSQSSPQIVEETIPEDVTIPIDNKKSVVIQDKEDPKDEMVEIPKEKVIKAIPSKKENAVAANNKKESSSIEDNILKEAIVVKDNSEAKVIKEETNEDVFFNSKVEEVVAQVQALQKSDNVVSAEEIDSLLLKAQEEIHSREILNNKKVDATALLNMVESELETNFRDKVFEALGDGYEKVRTAVVERNN